MSNYALSSKKKSVYLLADLTWFLIIALYAFLSWKGILMMSLDGLILDSDLQTYAQGMAGAASPEFFGADPVLDTRNAANSIPNLQRLLATRFLKDGNFGAALLSAGAVAIFVFYSGWYLLGRILFHSPVLAAMLALLTGITVWVGWGTFWGITHSDPVPRVFFGAIFPFLLLLALVGVSRPWARPLCMLATGLGMWAHGVGALNCGAMFYLAFIFLKPPHVTLGRHIWNLTLCLAAFLGPVIFFLWPSLFQGKSFSKDELAIFMELFNIRWKHDYSEFASRLWSFMSVKNPPFLVFLLGLFCWPFIRFQAHGLEGQFARMFPYFVLALAMVTCFCWAESRYAPDIGRLPMGHELIRGLRFCVPLSWILVVSLIPIYIPAGVTRFCLLALISGLLVFNTDRQYMAAQLAISEYTGLRLPLYEKAMTERAHAVATGNVIEMLQKEVPMGEPVFCDEDFMAIRYKALRPLSYSFKDGYVFFYNKDFERSREWLKTEKLIDASPRGYIDAWEASGAPWFLSRQADAERYMPPYAQSVGRSGDWILFHNKRQL